MGDGEVRDGVFVAAFVGWVVGVGLLDGVDEVQDLVVGFGGEVGDVAGEVFDCGEGAGECGVGVGDFCEAV